jgi:hypothetical protein
MSGFFQNIDPPPPSPPGECVPPAFCAGGGHTHWVERGGGVNILDADTALYSTYVSTLCCCLLALFLSLLVDYTHAHSPTQRRVAAA